MGRDGRAGPARIGLAGRVARTRAPPPPRSAIFDYWRDTRLRARLVDLEIEDALHFFALPIAQRCEARPDELIRILSLARDDARFELNLAQRLIDHGCENFRFECLDLRSTIRERREFDSSDEALSDIVLSVGHAQALADPDRYDVVLADGTLRAHASECDAKQFVGADADGQPAPRLSPISFSPSPHGPSRLDAMLDALIRVMRPDATFALSETLEEPTTPLSTAAREVVERIWGLMPPHYRGGAAGSSAFASNAEEGATRSSDDTSKRRRGDFNGAAQEQAEPPGIQSGPEAQTDDRLSETLHDLFHQDAWATFGHVNDAFIGPRANTQFDPEAAADRRFIDQVAQLDEARIAAGVLKPRHLAAWLRPRTD